MPQAIRVGNWKLYFDKVKEIEGSDKGSVLFDLNKDPSEKYNLSNQFPEKVKSMKAIAKKLLLEIEQNSISLGGGISSKKTKNKRGLWLK